MKTPKITRRSALALLGATASSALLPLQARAATDRDPPYLRPLIEAGKLPELTLRLPYKPRVVNVAGMGREAGRYGGVARTLIGGQKDIRMMTINGYARLIGLDEKLNFHADILEAFEPVEERSFTFHIRDGHKWSDGEPLTSEDFRYMWEDVLSDEDLAKGGYDPMLLVDGKPPAFEVVDRLTVRYTWEAPNPDFLPVLAAAQPISLVLPAHYMKQFHAKYQDKDKLDQMVEEAEVKNWATLHLRMARQYRPENPDLPTLDPWRNTTKPPAEQFVFERNPFFHRVDENGLQLPYIDQFQLNVSSSSIIPAKAGAGESDLQFTNLDFPDYTFLKDAEGRYPVKVGLWKRTQGSRVALLPNLNVGDEVWRKVLRDVRVRRALSLAIDRREINLAVFYGLAKESADTVLPESPLYKPEYQNAWIAHDVDLANKLLDEAGLTERGDDGIRLLPDGRSAQVVVETAGESTLETDVLELITDHWGTIGISLFIRTSQRDVFRSRAIGGEIMMAVWNGIDNGVPTADMNPGQLAPTMDSQLQWPVWGLHYISNGEKGEAPDMPEVAQQMERLRKWRASRTLEERTAMWHEMLAAFTDQVFSIGLVNQALQPVLWSRRLRNVPETALYGFEPTCFLGVYMPDTFWMSEEEGLTMLRYILWRIAVMVPTLLIISALIFTIIELPPGDYFESYIAELQAAGEGVDQQQIDELRHDYGFDQPPVLRYFHWLGGMLTGDFGYSFEYQLPVRDVVGDRLWLTVLVSFVTIIFTWLIAFPIGMYSATHQYSWGDYGLTFLGLIGIAIPNFMLALILMYFANIWFGTSIGHLMDAEYLNEPMSWAKAQSILAHLWIPVIIVGTAGTAGMIRRLRANLLDELQKQYVMTARAKGLHPFKTLVKYPLRMALNFFVSDIGSILPAIISGAEITAIVLSLETTGPMLIKALQSQDMYLAGSFLMFLAFLTVIGVLISDLALAILDPRIRLQGGSHK